MIAFYAHLPSSRYKTHLQTFSAYEYQLLLVHRPGDLKMCPDGFLHPQKDPQPLGFGQINSPWQTAQTETRELEAIRHI